jgi:hypothetical protein
MGFRKSEQKGEREIAIVVTQGDDQFTFYLTKTRPESARKAASDFFGLTDEERAEQARPKLIAAFREPRR